MFCPPLKQVFFPTFPSPLEKISVLRKAGIFLSILAPKLKMTTMKRLVVLMTSPLLFYYAWLPARANESRSGKIRTELQLAHMQDSLPHATVIFYRAYFPKYFSNVKTAPLYINDSLVHELKANTFISFNITKEGKTRVAVDKKQETEIEFKLKFGKEYFFRVDVTGGLVNRKTTIESVTSEIGKEEIAMLPKKAFEGQ
jgi:hypothetical protein